MTLEALRETVSLFKKGSKAEGKPPSKQDTLSRKEIKAGVKRLYNETGEFMKLLNASLGTTEFEVRNPNYSESNMPEPLVDFFETQYTLMQEDITLKIRADQDMNKNHSVYLELMRRGRGVSSISYCSYVRPGSHTETHIWTNLGLEELQPRSTIEAKRRIEKLRYAGDNLANDAIDLSLSTAILKFAEKEATRHIQSLKNEKTN